MEAIKVQRDKLLLLILTGILIVSAGCDEVRPPGPGSCTASQWLVDMTMEGGIGGARKFSMHFLSSGELTVVDSQNRKFNAQVSAEEVTRIGRLLQKSCTSSARVPQHDCHECFHYRLKVQMVGTDVFQLEATDFDKCGLEPLIDALESLAQASLSNRP